MVKKLLRTYQLYKQNLKIWFLFLFVSLLGACTQKPMPKPEQVSSMYTISSWNLQSIPERKDDPNIPNCEPLDLKPIKPEEIINIDDVVQNCKYETGHILYNPYEEKSKYVFQPIFLRKNAITSNNVYDENNLVCEYKGLLYRGIRNQDKWLEKIIVDNDLQSKNLVNSILPETDEDLETIFSTYKCKEKKLCKELIGKIAWNNNKHYFLYGENELSKTKWLIIDDKIYNIWDKKYIKSNNKNSEIIQEGPWIVDNLYLDTITVKKYTSWSLLEKYKNNPDHIYSEENEKLLTNKKEAIIWNFQIKTCKIRL